MINQWPVWLYHYFTTEFTREFTNIKLPEYIYIYIYHVIPYDIPAIYMEFSGEFYSHIFELLRISYDNYINYKKIPYIFP